VALAGFYLSPGARHLLPKKERIPILIKSGNAEPQRVANNRERIGLHSNYGGMVLFEGFAVLWLDPFVCRTTEQ
jgi:hypothetical protein